MKLLKYCSIFLLAIFVSFSPCEAQRGDVGFTFLASDHRKFPCKCTNLVAQRAPKPYLGTLYHTFGTKTSCWKQFIAKSGSKPHTIQFYASNETCRRKGICRGYEVLANRSVKALNKAICKKSRPVVKKIKRRFKEILNWCQNNGSATTRCILGLGLESQYNECATKKLVKFAKEVGWAKKDILHNPVGSGPYQGRGGAHFIEHHGVRPRVSRPGVVSLDGACPSICEGRCNISGSKISESGLRRWTDKYRREANFSGYWCAAHQGLSGNSQSVPHPRSRTPTCTGVVVNKFLDIAGYPR